MSKSCEWKTDMYSHLTTTGQYYISDSASSAPGLKRTALHQDLFIK